MLDEHVRQQQPASAPLTALFIVGADGTRHLALTVHSMVADNASREIILTDIFTAFGQRLAGEKIVLQPATSAWREWSQRCAGLANHPAVLERRAYWLKYSTSTTLRLTNEEFAERPHADDLERLSSVLTTEQTSEVDRARRKLQFTIEDVLLGALSRTLAEKVGDGVVGVDLAGDGRLVLKPDVNVNRTVGWFTTIYPVPLTCASGESRSAIEMLGDLHDTLKAVPHHGIGHGLLAHLYAPTARLLASAPRSDILVSFMGTIPDLPSAPGPVQFDVDAEMPVRDKVAGLGHPIELRAYRHAGALHLDWWYDTRRLERTTAHALMEYFPIALAELMRQASALADSDAGTGTGSETLALVDLSEDDMVPVAGDRGNEDD
jgi:phthiocerol/phenolphthiocerol synthesis type-I polyketide synthase E